MMAEEKSKDGLTGSMGAQFFFLTLCACIVTFLQQVFLGHGIFTFWIFFDPLLVRLI